MRGKRDTGLFNFLKIDRYYKMDNKRLVEEAVKYRIEDYGTPDGLIIKERIINQLLKKDKTNNSRFATFFPFLL